MSDLILRTDQGERSAKLPLTRSTEARTLLILEEAISTPSPDLQQGPVNKSVHPPELLYA